MIPDGDITISNVLLVPDDWSSIEITANGDALHQRNHTLTCTVRAIQGMNIAPQVEWYYPNGSKVEAGVRIKTRAVETSGTVTSLTLTFSPALHDDGGVYLCRAQVTIPWMTTQPPVKQARVNMLVISKPLV